jgi:hypothetical protein
MDSSSPDVIAPKSYAEPVVPCQCAYAISASVCPHLDRPIRLRSRIRCRVPGAQRHAHAPYRMHPRVVLGLGRLPVTRTKPRPFRVTPAFFLTLSVRACTLTAMLTTTTADGLTTGGRPLSTPLRSHLRALALYRGMYRDHGWAASAVETLLRTACVVVRRARVCRCCHGTGLGCGWPPCACGVCAGIGFEIKGG